MRCDQHRGLNGWARSNIEVMVAVEERGTRTYPDGHVEQFARSVEENLVKCEPSGLTYEGMFGDEYQFLRYTFPDGRVWQEYMQAEPWSSGPVFFLALKDLATGEVIKESAWPDEEIENY